MKAPRPAWLLAVVLLSGTSGCCTLARLFCGPDETPWVPISHASPEATLATFREAFRRNNPTQAFFCLAKSYVEESGLDAQKTHIVWEQLLEQVPHLHMLGYVELPEAPEAVGDRGVTYRLEAYGQVLRVDLVRQVFYEVRWRDPDGVLFEPGRVLYHDSLNGLVTVRFDTLDELDGAFSVADVLPIRFGHPPLGPGGEEPPRLDWIEHVAVGREWKIANLRPEQDGGSAAGG